MIKEVKVATHQILCAHCGTECVEEEIQQDDLSFCCAGCQAVYNLLEAQCVSISDQLDVFGPEKPELAYLDDPEVQEKIYDFYEGALAKVSFSLPAIHCSSCIYLLEHLNELHSGVGQVRVQFLKKIATITFNPSQIRLRQLVELLNAIGYAPDLKFRDLEEKQKGAGSKKLFYQLGLAGFCFGNIMLFSFPEYLGIKDAQLIPIFRALNVVLILPVLFYSASTYWNSALASLRTGRLNIDVPIVLGMATLFIRSLHEIVLGYGEGYLDSLAGFVFFLLIGRWFQDKTYDSISFDRDYKSYFPIAVMKKVQGKWASTPLYKVKVGDRLLIRNGELLPMDSRLISGRAKLDYSFVTGEAAAIEKAVGDSLYAGGRQIGGGIEVEAEQEVDQSYLTKLWDEQPFQIKEFSRTDRFLDVLGKYFTLTVIFIATVTGIFWWFIDPGRTFEIVTAVLIVACPCAIALALPFTYGNMLRLLAARGFFIRNVNVIQSIQDIKVVVFDKTGTLTDPGMQNAMYEGKDLFPEQQHMVAALSMQSTHPKAQAIYRSVNHPEGAYLVEEFQEIRGKGMQGFIDGQLVRMGSAEFIFESESPDRGVFVEIDGEYIGRFSFKDRLQLGVKELVKDLALKYQLALLSGDDETAQHEMQQLFPEGTKLKFHQKPVDKLNYIRGLQEKGAKVLFIGDGLNDAGALKQADVGMVLSGDHHHFTPSSDAIFHKSHWRHFYAYLSFMLQGQKLLTGAFVLAILYNVVGLGFAVQGYLSPIVAAILMPLSSITIIAYGLLSSRIVSWKILKKGPFSSADSDMI